MLDQAEIHRKARSDEVEERTEAAKQLRYYFADLPDKKQAWADLHRLTQDVDFYVRCRAADALGTAFQHVPEKEEAWNDLIQLMQNDGGLITDSLGRVFTYMPNKQRAWSDLIRLTRHESSEVRGSAVYLLGHIFPHAPDKYQTWQYLIQLTQDANWCVRARANYSLGKASIFKASDADTDETFEKEFKSALKYFKISSRGCIYVKLNPAKFCSDFYKSFYAITFEKAEGEVQRYLSEARDASEGSESQELLLEAVENLAKALSEAKILREADLGARQHHLNACQQYCDRAADLIGDAAESVPGAARVLQRGLPIIGERIKEIIREIQEKARAVCIETRGTGTPYEPLGIEVNKWARELSDRGYLQNERTVSRIVDTLVEFCNLLPEEKRVRPCKIVEEIRKGGELEDILSGIDRALLYLQPSIESELKSEENQIDHRKRTTIEISADIVVHVLVYTILHHFAEDLMPVIAPILVLSALTILLLIIRHAKSR